MHKLTAAHRMLPAWGPCCSCSLLTSGFRHVIRSGLMIEGRSWRCTARARRGNETLSSRYILNFERVGYNSRPEGMGVLRVQSAFADLQNARALFAQVQIGSFRWTIIQVDFAEGCRYRVQIGRFLTTGSQWLCNVSIVHLACKLVCCSG